MEIHFQHHKDTYELMNAFDSIKYRPVPIWLGEFTFSMHKKLDKLPVLIQQEINNLAALVPDQDFNTYFIQKYEAGQNVFPHRDPKNNVGYTIIGVYGGFYPTPWSEYTRTKERYQIHSGDTLIQECTINNQQGPQHSVTWSKDATGTRYCIILNTINGY